MYVAYLKQYKLYMNRTTVDIYSFFSKKYNKNNINMNPPNPLLIYV